MWKVGGIKIDYFCNVAAQNLMKKCIFLEKKTGPASQFSLGFCFGASTNGIVRTGGGSWVMFQVIATQNEKIASKCAVQQNIRGGNLLYDHFEILRSWGLKSPL